MLNDLADAVQRNAERMRGTWRAHVRAAMVSVGGRATLADLYRKVAENAPERLSTNANWKAKIRQVLQLDGSYEPASCGLWTLKAAA